MVHPGGLSDPAERDARRAALARGLIELAEHAHRGTAVRICVENMPPGVHPGSRMADLAELLRELNHPRLALALDTGHANLTAGAAEETLAAGSAAGDDPRPRQQRPPGRARAARSRHDRLARLGPGPRRDRLHRPDHAGMYPPSAAGPADYRPEVLRGLARLAGDA